MRTREQQKAYWDAYYAKHKEKYKARARKWRADNLNGHRNFCYRRKYGITLAQVEAMLQAQGGVCAICGKTETRRGKCGIYALHVDHCHETGVVRALVCHHCNAGLGHFKDNPDLLRAAAAYVELHGQRQPGAVGFSR